MAKISSHLCSLKGLSNLGNYDLSEGIGHAWLLLLLSEECNLQNIKIRKNVAICLKHPPTCMNILSGIRSWILEVKKLAIRQVSSPVDTANSLRLSLSRALELQKTCVFGCILLPFVN